MGHGGWPRGREPKANEPGTGPPHRGGPKGGAPRADPTRERRRLAPERPPSARQKREAPTLSARGDRRRPKGDGGAATHKRKASVQTEATQLPSLNNQCETSKHTSVYCQQSIFSARFTLAESRSASAHRALHSQKLKKWGLGKGPKPFLTFGYAA